MTGYTLQVLTFVIDFGKMARQVDPLKQKLPEAKPISKELKERYMVHMDPIKKQLDAIKSNVTFATKS